MLADTGAGAETQKTTGVHRAPVAWKDSRIGKREKYQRNSVGGFSPIVSYGIILFVMVSEFPGAEPTPKFLIYQRRDSYEYMDFLRGLWTTESRIFELFSRMSEEERIRIQDYTFDELWDDLWIEHEINIYRDGYDKAKSKFDSIKDKIPQFISAKSNFKIAQEPPWGFPKGKKNLNHHETDIECALREFTEETGLPLQNIQVWKTKPYSEHFWGNNNKAYSTYYYLAETEKPLEFTRRATPHCIRPDTLSEEARDAKWVDFDEACSKLDHRRQAILKRVMHLITTRYDLFSPFVAGTR